MAFARGWVVACAMAFAGVARAGSVSGPMVISESWPQATDLPRWAADVLRIEGKTGAPEAEQALALYHWTRLFVMSPKAGTEPYEGPYGQEDRLVRDYTKVMFVHGCGDCDYQARAFEAVWALYTGDDLRARRVNVEPPHTMTEVEWGGAWHAFDPSNGVFIRADDDPSANILSFVELEDADALIRANEHFVHRARPFFERVRSWDDPQGEWWRFTAFGAFYPSKPAWQAAGSPNLAPFAIFSRPSQKKLHDMDWVLPRGTTVERHWRRGPIFYVPAGYAAHFGSEGRHYRQAVEWDPSISHWNASEDLVNFPKVAPYLEPCTDPGDVDFYGEHTLYFVAAGTQVYEADLWSEAYLDAVESGSGMVRAEKPPYLRPEAPGKAASVIFRFRTPYIIADAVLEATLARGASDEARLLLSTDGGARWDTVASGEGPVRVNLGKSRFNGSEQSVCGLYEYLVRFDARAATDAASVGLSRFRVTTHIDGSLNALPRLADGANTIRFEVEDQTRLEAPVRVRYRWSSEGVEKAHERELVPADFSLNVASFTFDAGPVTRCLSYGFSYGESDRDGNGLPDGWERHFFGPTGQDPEGDPDGDGLSNLAELEQGSVPYQGPRVEPVEQAQEAQPKERKRGCGGSPAVVLLGIATTLLVLERRRAFRGASR